MKGFLYRAGSAAHKIGTIARLAFMRRIGYALKDKAVKQCRT
jgi:hypothetical protein